MCPLVESEDTHRFCKNNQRFYQVIARIGVVWSLCYVNTHRVKIIHLFLCSGNIGTELSSTNLGMFITSDAGNSWRQVRPICAYATHAFTLNTLCICVLSRVCFFLNADFWWRAQRVVSWQWRRHAGRLTRNDAHPTLTVGDRRRNYCR